MMKGKGKTKSKGGGKGGPASSTKNTGAPSGNSVIDTNKREYIYQMYRMTKQFGKGDGSKPVLNKINLSFYPGAKIGVLGNNGAGKSTLMKIMAGIDDNFEGEARPARWANVGYLSQEPALDNGATVGENIEHSVREIKALLKEYED